MTKDKLILVKTPDCTQCGMVISLIEQKGLDIEVVDATADVEKASSYETMSVPFIAVDNDKNSPENVKAIGGSACLAFINEI